MLAGISQQQRWVLYAKVDQEKKVPACKVLTLLAGISQQKRWCLRRWNERESSYILARRVLSCWPVDVDRVGSLTGGLPPWWWWWW
jgi:hypothetical protein